MSNLLICKLYLKRLSWGYRYFFRLTLHPRFFQEYDQNDGGHDRPVSYRVFWKEQRQIGLLNVNSVLLSCCYLCLCALQGHKSSWALLLLKIDALYWHILLFLAQKALCYILCLSRGWLFHTWRSWETSRKISTSIWRS